MRIQSPTVMKLGGLAIASITWRWMRTLEYKALYYDRQVDPTVSEFNGPAIFLFWHEYIPFLFYLRGHCNLAMLLSRHQDAEWLSQASRHMGFQTVRGSTNRGGVAALRELLRKSRSMNLAITPDGPRGPRRRLAQGCVFVSSKLGIPLVPIGLGYDQPWRNRRAWDHFAIPRPGSRARAVAGPFVQIPPDLSRDGYEHYRRRVEQLLNTLTERAEQWAETGERHIDEVVVHRQGAPVDGYVAQRCLGKEGHSHRAGSGAEAA